jgi:uncharacterized small protein (DUF1192 family)
MSLTKAKAAFKENAKKNIPETDVVERNLHNGLLNLTIGLEQEIARLGQEIAKLSAQVAALQKP